MRRQGPHRLTTTNPSRATVVGTRSFCGSFVASGSAGMRVTITTEFRRPQHRVLRAIFVDRICFRRDSDLREIVGLRAIALTQFAPPRPPPQAGEGDDQVTSTPPSPPAPPGSTPLTRARCGHGRPRSCRAPCAPSRRARPLRPAPRPRPSRGAHHIGREALELHVMLLDQRGERLGVEPLHFREREARFRRGGMRDDRLEVRLERLPGLERHDAFAGAVRLVEAGAHVRRRNPIEPERDVGAGADELGRVEHAGLQAGQDFTK